MRGGAPLPLPHSLCWHSPLVSPGMKALCVVESKLGRVWEGMVVTVVVVMVVLVAEFLLMLLLRRSPPQSPPLPHPSP